MNKDLVLKESLEAGLKRSLYSNFRKWTEAFLELLDNAVSNRILKKQLKVEVFTSPKHFRIVNTGGRGMNLKELNEFLQWGKIKERTSYDIGAYSQGGKAAMGYLGNSMEVIASPSNENKFYRIEDSELHNYAGLKKYPVITGSTNENGSVEIVVRGLRRKIKDEDVVSLIKETYRPLIENGEVKFFLNKDEIKIENFPLDISFKPHTFSFKVKKRNKHHDEVSGWIGRLLPRSGVRGGLRCYKLGRLIVDRQFFEHPDANYKQSLNFLFGEVSLDHVPATTNKTDFDRDSSEWEEIQEQIFKLLTPHVEDLLGRDIQEPTDEEKERVKKTKELLDELLRLRKIDIKGLSSADLYSEGQKTRNEKIDRAEYKNQPPKRENNPATPPPNNPVGKRKRLKEFLGWEVRPMDEAVRSKIEDKDGKKTLVINNLFPGFKAAKGNTLYLLETAAIQLSRSDDDEKLTVEEYIESFDDLYSFICNNLDKAKEKLEDKKVRNVN